MTIDGPGSVWSNSDQLFVGELGQGTLNIVNGGVVNNLYGLIGYQTDSIGMVTVSGAGSTWNSPSLKVGSNGAATLNIENGGVVNSTTSRLGNQGPGTGTVNGVGSTWNNLGNLNVDYSGALFINNGGVVHVMRVTEIDGDRRATGTINFNNGTLNTTSLLASPTELLGTGVINAVAMISDVDLVFDATNGLQPQIILNSLPGQNITINLDASGSVDATVLGAGYRGAGTLTIKDGLAVPSAHGYLGYHTGSTGTATVSGIGTIWNIAGDLNVGNSGAGTLNIIDGGVVSNSDSSIAAGSSSTVTVSGFGSRWNINNILYIGSYSGTGTLNLVGGGEVSVGGGITLDRYSSGLGVVNLSSGTLDLNGTNILTGDGDAAFNFTGGTLRNTAAIDLDQPFVQQGGTLAPGGSIGQTDIIGSYTLIGGTVEIEMGGVGNPHDLLTVTGDIDIALLGTTLDLPALGAMAAGTYTVIESTGGNLSGTFENITGLGIYAGLLDVQYTANAVTVTLNWDYLPGDLNADGFVGIDDLNIVLSNWNQNVPPANPLADPSGDGFVGIDDLNAVLSGWNLGTPPTSDSFNAIPEPASLGLLAVGVMCGSGCRRSHIANA